MVCGGDLFRRVPGVGSSWWPRHVAQVWSGTFPGTSTNREEVTYAERTQCTHEHEELLKAQEEARCLRAELDAKQNKSLWKKLLGR